MAEIRINTTGGLKLYDADNSHYAQILAGTITSNTDVLTLGHAAIIAGTAVDLNGNELILDADADTSITSDTDDTIHIKISGADDFTFTANTFTAESGSTIAAQALTATTVTASGIIKTDDTTAATSTTDGSLQTDGGLSVALDAVIGDDLYMLSDASVIHFGADSEITLTHNADAGLTLGGTTPTLTIGDAGAEDTKIVFDGNAQDFHIGLDDSADDLVIGLGSALGTTTHMAFDQAGHVTKPLQCAFLAKAGAQANKTGNDTEYTVEFGSAERFDQNADFDVSGGTTFTAPVTGKYFLSASVGISGGDSNITYSNLYITTSNQRYDWFGGAAGNMGEGGSFKAGQALIADMDANDTAVVKVSAGGMGGDTLDLTDNSYFCGYLVC